MIVIKKIIAFTLLIILCILLILMIIFNGYTYTFENEIMYQEHNEKCQTVYYEPYSIFKYRKFNSSSSWITKDGNLLTNTIMPGSYVYLLNEVPNDVQNNSAQKYYEININEHSHYQINKKEYEKLKLKGISTDENSPTEIDYFIGNINNDYSKIEIYNPEDILGNIRTCKE